MSPERGANTRRTPVQERSVATVDAIVEAAAQVFARHGYEAGTTNRIAERAGVSIGTVYQYFPDKDAILVALVEEHLDGALAALTPLLTDLVVRSPPVEEGIPRMLQALVELHRRHPALHRVLFEEAPRPEALRHRLDRTVGAAVDAVTGYLESRPEVLPPDRRLAAQLVVQIGETVTHNLVINPRDGADPESYVRETEVLLVRYLTGR
ncbi:TetR/AcrR family transcriptional regulator [Patulibacter minatonensis]|uniref:TetR/AcrR family transcriptional regulator n=1 Tax=Patulibacter minatonensis TaxID=298163 RepID=UPI00047EC8CD|nr:TetR/AcrR family transcriptional regulator [Patulibacter minatonensis]